MSLVNPSAHESYILRRLKSDYIFLAGKYEVVGLFVFGSQNYETHTVESDVDIKAIVMPKVDDLLLGNFEVKETYKRDNGELTVFDIKSMHDNIKKLNINFLEILFTEYRIINPTYKDLWFDMITLREDIAYHHKHAAMKCIYGCAQNKFSKLFHKVPSNEEKIDKVGYDYKAWADILRFWEMMQAYKIHKPYENILKIKSVNRDAYDHIMNIKTCTYVCSPNQIKEDSSAMKQNMEFFMDKYIEEQSDTVNQYIVDVIDEITLNCLKAYVNERCYKERWPVLSC